MPHQRPTRKYPPPASITSERKAEIIQHVLVELSKGRALSTICAEDEEACGYSTFLAWQSQSSTLTEQIADAREAGATKLLEEVVTIADDRKEDPQSRKVRIYAREKYAAMIAPRRFGARVDVTSGGKPLEAPPPATVLVDNRVQALLTLAVSRAQGEPTMIDARPAEPSVDDVMR